MTLTPSLERPAESPLVPPRRPRLSVVEAIRRHKLLVITPMIVFLIIALVLGVKRHPVYTAESRLAVVRIDVSTPGALAGFAVASQSLAETYSRAVTAEAVTSAVARDVGANQATIATQISAAPVPQTPVFQIITKAADPERAVLLANLAGDELIKYIKNLNRNDPRTSRLYADYQKAAFDTNKARAQRDALTAAYNRSKSSSMFAKLLHAEARFQARQLRTDSLRQQYLASQQSQPSGSLIQKLSRAQGATSDRSKRLGLLLFIALVAGAAVGVALAILRAERSLRRAFR